MDDASEPAAAAVTTTTTTLPPPPRGAEFLSIQQQDAGNQKKLYWDRSHYQSPQDQIRALERSKTLYVGNLAFSTRSRHVRAHFEQIGPVKAVQMGLDRLKKTPCGFCFVEYESRADALAAVALLSGTRLDGKVIRVELDAGFQPGRQYGRGVTGGQVRDDRKGAGSRQERRKRERGSTTSGTAAPSLTGALPTDRGQQGEAAAPAPEGGGDGHYGPKDATTEGAEGDKEQDDGHRMEQSAPKRQKTF